MSANQDQELIQDFLIESNQHLADFEQQLVALEQNPGDEQMMGALFRAIHTIKGTCGFLGFEKLEKVAHHTENLLGMVRDGQLAINGDIVSVVLKGVDAIRRELNSIEKESKETTVPDDALLAELGAACRGEAPKRSAPEPAPEPPPPPCPVAAIESPPPAVELPAPPAVHEPEPAKKAVADTTIRLHVELLDQMMSLASELVLVRNQALQEGQKSGPQDANSTLRRLDLVTSKLQETVLKSRLQPVSTVLTKAPRLIRDCARDLGKQIELVMEGTNTETDRSILEAIRDPLTHILRNACDHGFETPEERKAAGKSPKGTLRVRAFHEAGKVVIEISDDGRGMDAGRLRAKAVEKGLLTLQQVSAMSDAEACEIIFLPGFSTAKTVTKISGRGVGMDVVRRNLETVNGSVQVRSKPGAGTTLRMVIPLTLSIAPALVVEVGGQNFLVPQNQLEEVVRLDLEERRRVQQLHGCWMFGNEEGLLASCDLAEFLGLPSANASRSLLVVRGEGGVYGLIVDRVLDRREIVVKALPDELKGLHTFAGATVLGDGRPALILDVHGLGRAAGLYQRQEAARQAAVASQEKVVANEQTFLTFGAGTYEHLAVPIGVVARVELVERKAIQRSGRRWVVNEKGRLMPVGVLAQILSEKEAATCLDLDPVPMIVVQERGRSAGILVDRIERALHGVIQSRIAAAQEGIQFSIVINDEVADLVDVPTVLGHIDETWVKQRSGKRSAAKTALVVDPSGHGRGLVRHYLEIAGHRVIEAPNAAAVARIIETAPIDIVVTSLEGDGENLRPVVTGPLEARGKRLPVLALSGAAGSEAEAVKAMELLDQGQCDDVQDMYDYKGMLRSLDRLLAAVQEKKDKAPVEVRA
jgi:two-component system chemotaxis sensor kinase CheA